MKPLTSFCYTSDDYPVFFRKWERCRDIFAGSDLVKSLGDKYLPKSRWHRHGGADGKQDYEDYKARAIFFAYLKDAIETSMGILKKGFFCTLCKKREENSRTPCAVKSQSGIIGRVAPFYSV